MSKKDLMLTTQTLFLSLVALLEKKMSTRFSLSSNQEKIPALASSEYFDGVKIVILTDFTEIQFRFDLEEEVIGQAKKEALIQAGIDRPKTISEKQLSEIGSDQIPEVAEKYTDNLMLFFMKLRLTGMKLGLTGL